MIAESAISLANRVVDLLTFNPVRRRDRLIARRGRKLLQLQSASGRRRDRISQDLETLKRRIDGLDAAILTRGLKL